VGSHLVVADSAEKEASSIIIGLADVKLNQSQLSKL